MKHLNVLLSEKKENILTYEDQIANMRAELAVLREKAMANEEEKERLMRMGQGVSESGTPHCEHP